MRVAVQVKDDDIAVISSDLVQESLVHEEAPPTAVWVMTEKDHLMTGRMEWT